MSFPKGRSLKLKLFIPPEASNVLGDKKETKKDETPLRIMFAKERRISSLTRILEPSFSEPFYFLYITGTVEVKFENHLKMLTSLVNKINSMKPLPKFIVLCGGLTQTCHSDVNIKVLSIEGVLGNLDSKIRVIFVPAMENFKNKADHENVEVYRNTYGDDWYGFWVCGVSFMVINSLYFKENIDASLASAQAEQEDWIESELLQQQVFYAQWTMVFQDSLITTNTPEKGENADGISISERDLVMLKKYQQSGVSHVFCRSTDVSCADMQLDDIEVVANAKKDGENVDWNVRLVKVTADNIEHREASIEELPEHVEF